MFPIYRFYIAGYRFGTFTSLSEARSVLRELIQKGCTDDLVKDRFGEFYIRRKSLHSGQINFYYLEPNAFQKKYFL